MDDPRLQQERPRRGPEPWKGQLPEGYYFPGKEFDRQGTEPRRCESSGSVNRKKLDEIVKKA